MHPSVAVYVDRYSICDRSLRLPKHTKPLLWFKIQLTTSAKPYVSARTALNIGSEKKRTSSEDDIFFLLKHQAVLSSTPAILSPEVDDGVRSQGLR
jgi:hypothetical protein